MNLRNISSTFLRGLVAVVPAAVTVAVIAWLLSGMEQLLGGALKRVIRESWYVPGMGIALGLIGVFLVGLLLHAWIFRKILNSAEVFINRLPIVRSIYGATRDLFQFIKGSGVKGKTQQVVLVTLANDPPLQLIGMLTREEFDDLPLEIDDDLVAVYLPMSYQIGGYMVLVPRSRIEPIDMGIQDAMRFILTAGIKMNSEGDSDDEFREDESNELDAEDEARQTENVRGG